MAKQLVTRIVPVVTTWWGGEPVKVKFIVRIDKQDCTLEIEDYTVFGWGVDSTVAVLDVSLGVSFDVKVNWTGPDVEPCAETPGTCRKVINVLITVIQVTSILGKEFQTEKNDVTAVFYTNCYKQCCKELEQSGVQPDD